jgi:outer membrane biogenesis lipoprotein LolB
MKQAEDQRRTYGNLKWDGIRDGIKYNLRLNGHVSETTVKIHVAHVLDKLRLRDRVQSVIVDYEAGLAWTR